MSRIYTVTSRATGKAVRYVRATTMNQAIRAAWGEVFEAAPTTADAMYAASKGGGLDVLDAEAQTADE